LPISPAARAGSRKIPVPMIVLIAIAVKSQRLMPRTSPSALFSCSSIYVFCRTIPLLLVDTA
jgi:hypothetical protein